MLPIKRAKTTFGRPKRSTINHHLSVLGCRIAYRRKGGPKPTLRMRYKSIGQLYEAWDVLYRAKRAYRLRMTTEHPDRGGDKDAAKVYGESYAWIKKWCRRHGAGR